MRRCERPRCKLHLAGCFLSLTKGAGCHGKTLSKEWKGLEEGKDLPSGQLSSLPATVSSQMSHLLTQPPPSQSTY